MHQLRVTPSRTARCCKRADGARGCLWQYNDMLKDVGAHPNTNTIFMPSGGAATLSGQMMQANLASQGMRR